MSRVTDSHMWRQVRPSQCCIRKSTSNRPPVIVHSSTQQSLWGCAVSSGGTKEQTPLLLGKKNHLWLVSVLSSHWALSYWKSNVSNITGHHEALLLLEPFMPSPHISSSRHKSFLHITSLPYPGLTTPLVSPFYQKKTKTRLYSTDKLDGSNMNRALTVDEELLLIDSPASFITGTAPFQPAFGGWRDSLIAISANVSANLCLLLQPRNRTNPSLARIDPLCLRGRRMEEAAINTPWSSERAAQGERDLTVKEESQSRASP